MPIPASQIVSVNPRLMTPGGNDLAFNALFLTSSPVIPVDQFVVSFATAEDVGAYFGLNSAEYDLAQTYFLGYSDSFTKPDALLFAPRVNQALAAFIRGGALSASLVEIQAIEDGTLSVTMGGTTADLSGLDFTTAASFSDVAGVIQTALNSQAGAAFASAVVTYSSVFKAFTITSGTTGADESLTVYPSGTVADALNFTAAAGAVLSAGSAAMTPAENMAAIIEKSRNFVTFMSIDQLSESDVLAFSEWANNQGVEYLHVWFDTSAQLTQTNPVGTIAAAVQAANLGANMGIYGPAEYAAFACSVAACIDYDRTNGTITLKFKGQSGLAPLVTTASAAANLEANGMNYVGNWATRNDQFIFFAPGQMFGEYQWADVFLNAVWLNNALQVACMNGFTLAGRVPYTEEGYALIRAWCLDPINRALRSGVIEPGVTLAEVQKAQLMREAGRDISAELFTDGYVLQIKDPAPAVRQQRGTPEASLWYTYGGAVHKLEIASTAIV